MSIDRAILYDKVLTRRDIAAIDSQLLLDVSFSMVRVKITIRVSEFLSSGPNCAIVEGAAADPAM